MSTPANDPLRLLWGSSAAEARVVPAADRGSGLPALLGHATRRETAVLTWRLRGGRRTGSTLWRRPPAQLRRTPRDAVLRRLAAGVVWVPGDAGPSATWRDLARDAGFTPTGPPAEGMDGSLRVVGRHDGAAVVLRVGVPGSPADPLPAARALELVHLSGLPACPRVLRTGRTDGWSWSVEHRVPGTRPRRVGGVLLRDVAQWAGRLAAVDPGTSAPDPAGELLSQAETLAASVPWVAPQLQRLVQPALAHPVVSTAVPAHGDLWSGNLLVEDGRLAGVVDWDAFTLGGIVGTDIVHLVTTELRLRRRLSLGAVAAARPWHDEPLRALLTELAPGCVEPRAREAVGTCWWLQHVVQALRRVPALADDQAWVEANVRFPLTAWSES